MARTHSANKNDISPQIVHFGQPSRANRKACRPRLAWDDDVKKHLREMGTSWENVKNEALDRLGWMRSVRSCVGLPQFSPAVSY